MSTTPPNAYKAHTGPEPLPNSKFRRNPFTEMMNKAKAAGMHGARTQESIDWFRKSARAFKNNISHDTVSKSLGKSSMRSVAKVGHLYMFAYDAKYKDELPYWDAYPCTVIIGEDGPHFMGINFHYLPPGIRAFVFDQLYQYSSDPTSGKEAKLRLTYKRINRLSAFPFMQQAVKKYLKSHVKSSFIHIPQDHWHSAIFLPTARWQKAAPKKVYDDHKKHTGKLKRN